jgi:hypothetical protein
MNKWMLVLLLLFPLNLSAFPYVCIIEDSVGYYKNPKTKEWKRSIFHPKEKYLLTKSKDPYYIAELKIFGESVALSQCGRLGGWDTDFSVEQIKKMFNERGLLECSGVPNATINVKNLKIITTSIGGYIYLEDEKNSDTPSVSIGSCSPL